MHSIHDILNLLRQAASRTAIAVACLVMVVGLTSCGNDYLDIEEPREGGDVWISFRIANQGAFTGYANQSRSNNDTQAHPDEAATAAENYVDLNDLRIIFFGPDKKAFKSLTSDDFSYISLDPGNISKTSYTLTASVDKSMFHQVAGGSRISIMAIANVTGTKNADPAGKGGNFPLEILGMTYEDLSVQLSTFTFHNTRNGTGSIIQAGSWRPDGHENRIPMSGLLHTVAPTDEQLVAANSFITPYDFTDPNRTGGQNLELQRAMVKIRILDGVEALSTLQSGRPHIKSVTLKGGNVKGAYLPLYKTGFSPQWFIDGTSVLERSAKPDPTNAWADLKSLGLDEEETWIELLKEDEPVTVGNKKFDWFMCYTPEQHSVTGVLTPYLEIVVDEGADGKETKYSPIYLKDVLSSSYNDMARNHIYEFTVTRNEKVMLDVTYKICPWSDMSSGDINFD